LSDPYLSQYRNDDDDSSTQVFYENFPFDAFDSPEVLVEKSNFGFDRVGAEGSEVKMLIGCLKISSFNRERISLIYFKADL